jgi:hypothetical protein
MSKPITFRLNATEQDMLSHLLSRDNCEPANATEFFRLLLHREYNRCTGKPAPKFADVSSEFRNGRPVAVRAAK